MGYYLVKWLGEPYTLQEDTLDGMSGMIGAETMVVDAIYFNRVERAPHWYTQSGKTMVAEVRNVLQTGLHLQPIQHDKQAADGVSKVGGHAEEGGQGDVSGS